MRLGAGIAALTSAVGVVLSVILTYWKYRADYTCDASPLNACEIGPGFSCAVAFSSDWATLFGLPLTIYAAALYIVTLALSGRLFLRAGPYAQQALRMLGLIALWNVAVSVFLAGVAAVGLHTICLYCALLYLISLVLLGAVTVMWLLAPASARASRRSALTLAVMVGLGFSLAVGVQAIVYQQLQDRDHAWARSCEAGPLVLPETDLQHGRDDAAVVLAMFVDPACPSCRREFESLKALVDERPERAAMRLYHYPRERGACGPPGFEMASSASMAHNACEAARAVACVEVLEPGAGVEMLARVFALQDGPSGEPYFTRRKLAALAVELGLELDPEDATNPLYMCMRGNSEVARRIAEHMSFGQAQGVAVTPQTYVIPRGPSGALNWRRSRAYAGVKPRSFIDEEIAEVLRSPSSSPTNANKNAPTNARAHTPEPDHATR